MELQDLVTRFSDGRENQQKAIFSTLFIAGNRLQTLFDQHIPEVSLKQFMLLSLVRQAREPMTLTQLGRLLGCSRQNVKKLALALEKKGFVTLQANPRDPRAACICPTGRVEEFFTGSFAVYQQELQCLFAGYTDEELAALFRLLTRLYPGIDALEQEVQHEAL